MIKKMKNLELINAKNALLALQKHEKSVLDETGKHLFQGRIKISYAINRNLSEIDKALQPCIETLNQINEIYRDTQAEKNAMKAAMDNGEDTSKVKAVFRESVSQEEYLSKRKELLEMETEVDIHTISIDLFEGVYLNSGDIGLFMFMLTE